MAALIPFEKGLVLINEKTFLSGRNEAGYHPEPVMPTTADVDNSTSPISFILSEAKT